MEPLILTYQGNDYDAAIEEARRQNPNHKGVVIVIPKGRLERLLGTGKGLKKHEDEQWQAKS